VCAQCDEALRGTYIIALDKKYHTNHFTCNDCSTVFGPDDSYYEHESKVYCHFHYSTRFAVSCSGCDMSILKQYVEIERNDIVDHWHPECYMIQKVNYSVGLTRHILMCIRVHVYVVLERQDCTSFTKR
jgi:hypothetical protein